VNENLNSDQFKLQYARRKGSSPNMGEMYGQHIEPHGRYLTERDPAGNYPEDLYETGEVSFKNPLHVSYGTEYSEGNNWKHQLPQQFGGATGRKLSNKIVAAGHDGIVTHDDQGTREIVDLTGLKKRKR
jgi:hypothetical protein